MQLGVTSTALGETKLPEAFRKAGEVGAEGIEISYGTDKDAKALYRKNHPAKLSELRRTSGVQIPSMVLGVLCKNPSLNGDSEEIAAAQELVLQALSVAGEAGVKVVVLPFFGKNTIELEEELTRAADALLELADHAEQAGVVLAVESTLNFDRRDFLLDHVGNSGTVKICLNTGVSLARKMDLPTGIRNLGPEAIGQIRFKDVRIAEARPPDYDVQLGEGDVDFLAAGNALRAVGWDGWVIVEAPPGDDPVAAGKKNTQFAKDIIASLK